jgi:hypothetical protein
MNLLVCISPKIDVGYLQRWGTLQLESLEVPTCGASDIWETEKSHCDSRPNQGHCQCLLHALDLEGWSLGQYLWLPRHTTATRSSFLKGVGSIRDHLSTTVKDLDRCVNLLTTHLKGTKEH